MSCNTGIESSAGLKSETVGKVAVYDIAIDNSDNDKLLPKFGSIQGQEVRHLMQIFLLSLHKNWLLSAFILASMTMLFFRFIDNQATQL